MDDILIVGAGPAGAIAGLVAARAGARVRIVDRAAFPRDKLCGDTINPGALAVLRRLGVDDEVEARGLRVDGMVVTGERGQRIEGRYPDGLHGRAVVRRDLDAILLDAAIEAGCQFDPGVQVSGALVEGSRVVGVRVGGAGVLTAPVVIAADGRHSTIAFSLCLARHPRRPRRWAIGAYFAGVRPGCRSGVGSRTGSEVGQGTESGVGSRTGSPLGVGTLGEMHVRRNCYIGVAAVPGDLTNVCLVKPVTAPAADFRDPSSMLCRALAEEPILRDRFADARLVAPPTVIGPLAVDVIRSPPDGLILAGDAAGFIDPMTGDGLRFAFRGGELSAAAALQALALGWTGIHRMLARARASEFGTKWRLNRALRALVGSPRAVTAATSVARVAPAVFRALIARAGDCDLAA